MRRREMINMLKRHQIQVLRGAGHKLKQIAKKAGVSERSARRIAKESPVVAVDDGAARAARCVGRPSTVEPFRKSVEEILAKDADVPTVEIVRLVRNQGYDGGKSALYDLVRSLRKVEAKPLVRFEGVAGEFSQHDFGEVQVTYVSGKSEKVIFFASRLKYSRFTHVEVVPDQRVEALVRGLIRSFEVFGGVPLVSVFDNPRTVVLFRKDRVIEWNATFGQAALDLRFAPELCWPRRANQKGAVENLVGWVKSSFFKVRRFHDRADLECQLREWLEETNQTRPSRATGVIPADRLNDEKDRLRPLPFKAEEYALRFPIMVGPTGLVEFDGYRYSMPPRAIGIPGTLFLFPDKVRITAGRHDAWHPRFPAEGKTSYRAEDRAATLAAVSGERAKLYSKRQQILELGGVAETFLTEIVHRRPRTWKGDVERLYDLLLQAGPKPLLAAMGRATAKRLFGAEHVAEIVEEAAA
jgi:transposase